MSDEQKTVFITGISSGLGESLSEVCLDEGWQVYGCSRRGSKLGRDIQETKCDLADLASIEPALDTLLANADKLDLVVLNAGMNYGVKLMVDTPLEEIKHVMDVNVWANKVILDWLHKSGRDIDQIVLVSSGAGVVGTKGWSSYGLSKCTLNMLTKLYCHEFENTHMAAIAPGVTMSEMLQRHLDKIDVTTYPHLQHFADPLEAGTIQGPAGAARRLFNVLGRLKKEPTGQYFDPSLMRDHG